MQETFKCRYQTGKETARKQRLKGYLTETYLLALVLKQQIF